MPTLYDSNFHFTPVTQDPIDLTKPLQHIETVKDIFVFELQKFFAANSPDRTQLLTEIPTLAKYQIMNPNQGGDNFVCSVNVIRQLPDINQQLPILAITTATGRSVPLGIGTQFVGIVQLPPQIQTTRGPWVLPENAQLYFQTGAGLTIITFTSEYIPDFNSVQPRDLVNTINAQSSRVLATLQPDSSVVIALKNPMDVSLTVLIAPVLNYAGTVGAPSDPSGYITPVDGDQFSGIDIISANADAATPLGLAGQSDNTSNPLRPPKRRYQTAKDLVLNIDVGTDDDNQRTELTDLLMYFLELRLNFRDFALLGDTTLGQNWQIIMKQQATLAGESEIPRAEGDGYAKIYINRISIPLVIVDYVDRAVVPVSAIAYQGGISLDPDQQRFYVPPKPLPPL